MRIKTIIAGLFMSLSICSCKNEDKKEQEEQVKENTFDIVLSGIYPKDDELVLFYKDNSISYFDEKNTTWLGIKGSGAPQTLKMSVPEGFIPNNFRIDISSKDTQEKIDLTSITITFEGRSFVIQKKDLSKYFTANGNMTLDNVTGDITIEKGKNGYDPYLLTKVEIFPELEKVRGIPL